MSLGEIGAKNINRLRLEYRKVTMIYEIVAIYWEEVKNGFFEE